MRIFNLRSEEFDNTFKLSVTIESERLGTKDVWFAIQKKYSNYLCTTRMDAFLVGLLYPAMQYGENIIVEGCISKKLLFNINNYVIPLLMTFSDSAKKITVSAHDVSSEKLTGNGVGTGFSGGIDSFNTVFDLYENEIDLEMKVNTLLFLNVGSHGPDSELSRSLFRNRYKNLEEFPKEIGLDFICLDSNLHQFHPWGHEKVHTLTGAAGILAMQNHFSRYYYSSTGLNYKDIIFDASQFRDIDVGCYCDPILLPLLSTETTDLVLHGAAHNRVDKILALASYEPTYRFLNVCVVPQDTHTQDTQKNCSGCSKCLMTLFVLDISGNLDNYSSVFDISKYKKLKSGYMCNQVSTQHGNAFSKANVDFAKQERIKLPGYFKSYSYRLLHINKKRSIIKVAKVIAPNIYEKLKP